MNFELPQDIAEQARRLVVDGGMPAATFARALGVKVGDLEGLERPDWCPSREVLKRVSAFLADGEEATVLVPIEEIIEEARNGRMFILVDEIAHFCRPSDTRRFCLNGSESA